MKPTTVFAAGLLLMAGAAVTVAAPAAAGVLDRARQSGELRMGYRADARPFSFKDGQGIAHGYSVDLCRAVATEAAAATGRPDLRLVEVEVTATDRLDAVQTGKVDILCEATTVTLSRRERMDFSLPTFATGATLLYAADGGASRFEDLAGKKVDVLAGSTTEAGLQRALERARIAAEVISVASYPEGIDRLAKGEITAFFGDGALLLYNLLQSPHKDRLKMSDLALSFEPYALALPKGEDDFRLAADRALAKLSRSGDVALLFERNFGSGAKPSPLVEAIWTLNNIPD
jgi:polar amino acid transport system substrate-binding protein/glutamate/aspartate transport system substrate-binding protein